MTHSSFRLALALIATHSPLMADIIVPGANGTDEALNITADTVIDLSQAPTGTWDQNNSAQAGKGVYDPEKWAVVFKYSSVNIATGTKVTFKNHATRAPVVWLVNGDVTIAGTVDLSGQSFDNAINYHPTQNPQGGALAEPGPGGFRGGAPWRGGDVLGGAGFGPGGGWTLQPGGYPNYGTSAGFGTAARDYIGQPKSGGVAYGNPSLIPLIGGSGGGGGWGEGWGFVGGAGGGAMLLATSGTLTVNGAKILAVGGSGSSMTGAGSGGGIRLVSSRMGGTGSLNATGGAGYSNVPNGGSGRIRLERVENSADLTASPAPSVVDLAEGGTVQLWPPPGAPQAKIVSVNSLAAPADPKASFGAYTPDVALPMGDSAVVLVETVNVEEASKVIVRITPRNGMTVGGVQQSNATEVNAVVKEVLATTPLTIRWEATVPTLPGSAALQARVIRP